MNCSIQIKKEKILLGFKHLLIDFMDELVDQYPREGDFVIYRISIKDIVPIQTIMLYFTEKILPLSSLIKDRDEKFFLENNILFSELDKEGLCSVNYFRQMWKNLGSADRLTLWKWFDMFVTYTERYHVLCSQN